MCWGRMLLMQVLLEIELPERKAYESNPKDLFH